MFLFIEKQKIIRKDINKVKVFILEIINDFI